MKKKHILIVFSLALLAAGCCCNCAKETAAKSPDGRNRIKLFVNPLSYEVSRDGVVVVERSPIEMRLADDVLNGSGKVARVSCGTYSGLADAAVYKRSKVKLDGNWVLADYGDWAVRLVARNDGVAYRFETRKNGRIKVCGETASVCVGDLSGRCHFNYTGRFGCEETVSQSSALKDAVTSSDRKKMIYLPFAYEKGGKKVLVTESDVYDYPVWNLARTDSASPRFDSLFANWPAETFREENSAAWNIRKGVEKGGRWVKVKEFSDYIVETDGRRTFPWRVVMLGESYGDFCNADIVWALARPQAEGDDFSWVKPGKVAWDWWSAFDNKGDPEGCTTETYVRFIDFAAKNGVEYVIFDEGWSEKLNIWKYHPNVDVPYLVDYASKKGVGIILWMAWAQAYGDEARVAKHFAKLGVKGFKVDFMDRGDAQCERFLWNFAEECRKEKMIVDFHGAHRPTGMSRAYPNVLNYEGVHGLEQTKWFRNNYDFMANDVKIGFLRMSAGALDYTPGAMDNYPIGKYLGTRTNPGSVGTRARQMAMMALYFAPLQMLCDAPTKYEKNPECFGFMSKIPVVWDETVALGGSPESFIAVARKGKDGAWYVAAITDSASREIEVDTARFLEKGDWKAEIFRDDTEKPDKPSAYIREVRNVSSGDRLLYRTSAGGGFVLKFTK